MTSTASSVIGTASENKKKVLPWDSIKVKLLSSFAIVIFLLVIQIVYFATIHFKIVAQYKEVTDNLILENSLSSLGPEFIQSYLNIINSPNDNTRVNKYKELHIQIDDVLATLDTKIVDRDSNVFFRGLKNYMVNIIDSCDEGVKEIEDGNLVESIRIYDDVIKKSRFINENVSNLVVKELTYAEKLQTEIGKTHISLLQRSITLIVIMIIVCILFTMFLARKMIDPIIKLSDIANRITKGNLNVKVDERLLEKKDETGILSNSFNKMLKRLHMEINLQKKISTDLKKSKAKLEEYSQQLKKENIISIKKEKTKLETLINDLGEGVVAIDLKGNVIMINQQAENMFGKRLKDCLGKFFADVFDFRNHKGEKSTMDNFPVADVIKKKKTIYSRGHFLSRGHDPLSVSADFSPILFDKKLIGIVATFRDITEEEKVDKAKSEFVSLASHQLQTPLTAVKWFLEALIEKEHLNRKQQRYVKTAIESNERMISLVEDFLNVSRLEGGGIAVHSREGDFIQFAGKIIQEAKTIAKAKHQKIIFSSSHKKIPGFFDPNLISQILSNLLSNAIHYSDVKSEIKISLIKKNKKIEIKVTDSGMGISKKDQKELFNKFFRTKKSAHASTTGSGLGLYIVKKILDVCKGQIKCESEPGKGTTFTVLLPLKGPVIKKKGSLIGGRIT